MPLLPAYYTTNSTRKRKNKKINPSKFESGWREHNKFLKRLHEPVITLDEYIDYCHGKTAKPKPKKDSYTPPWEKSYRRETPNIPSYSGTSGNVTKKESPVYTGNAVIGQAYNKGGLQVLSESEASDPMTGKRR